MAGSETDIQSHSIEEEVEYVSQTSTGLDIDAELECQSLKVSAADKIRVDIFCEKMCLSAKVSPVDENRDDIVGKQVCKSSKKSVYKNGMDVNGEHKCQSPEVSSIDKPGMDAKCEHKGQSPIVSSRDNQGMDMDSKLECHSPDDSLVVVSCGNFSGKDDADIYVVPEHGVEFESEDHAYRCYNRYASLEGFSIRKDFINRSRVNGFVVSRRYTCYKEGYRRTKHGDNVKKPRKDTRTGCLAHMTIARQRNGQYRVTHFETKHNHEFATPFTAHMLPSQRITTFEQAVESEFSNNSVMDGVPILGMEFDSEDLAYEFYNAYAGQVGFSVRKDYVNRSKVDGAVASRRFTCFREGFRQKDKRGLNVKRPRKETRIGCLAQLVIARQPDGKYRITRFEEKHNHELVPFCRVRILQSQKRSTAVQDVESIAINGSGMQPNSASDLIFPPVGDGESLGYRPVNDKCNLPAKRMRNMRQGESESILQYFLNKQLKHPSFFYAVQLDAEDEMTNVFWADEKMLADYSDFGDVVCLDTTYRLNKACRPFALFIGVNHHKQMLVFGTALLYDETVESFQWLFQKFLHAVSGKKPKTILTDQDAVMAEAINLVLPEAHHQLCPWHVYQNALKHLSQVTVGLESFANDLSSCIFSHDEEQDFIDAWKAMLDMYGLWENEWLHHIFEEREKWAIPYSRNIFCADVKSAQLSENLSTNLRKYLKSNLDVLQFFKHFGRAVNNWRYKEIEANYDMNQCMPRLMGDVILLKHARDVYTPKIFELFQQEYENCLNVIVNQHTKGRSLFEYKVSVYGQVREHTVVFNSSEDSIVCNCMMFQSVGILCSHALKVLDYRNIKVVPTRYILKRWTKDARV